MGLGCWRAALDAWVHPVTPGAPVPAFTAPLAVGLHCCGGGHRDPAGPGGAGGHSNPFPWLCSLRSPGLWLGLGSGDHCCPGRWHRQRLQCWAVPGPGRAEVELWSPLVPGQLAGGPTWLRPAWGCRSCPDGAVAGRRRGAGLLPAPLLGLGCAWLWGCGGHGCGEGRALLAQPHRGFTFHHRAKTGPCLHLG